MLEVEQDEQGQRIPGRQLGREHGVEPANHPHEARKGKDTVVRTKAQDAQQDGVDAAEMKGKGPVDGEAQVRIEEGVDQLKDLHPQHQEADALAQPATVSFHAGRRPKQHR